jgi:transcription antitermination factor NusG
VTQNGGALSISTLLQPDSDELIRADAGSTVDQPAWFAVQTRPRHEKRVSAELKEKGINAFLPVVSTTRQWSDRRRIVELPLFSQYVFVRIAQNSNTRVSVLRTNGVTNFVGPRGIGVTISDQEIDGVRRLVAQSVSVSPHPFLNVGNRVRIRGGALDGLQGILKAVNGDQTLVLSVKLIQRSLAIRIAGFAVEPV